MADSDHVVVYVTAPPDKAPDLARALVDSRLVACANLVSGVRSFYHWEGKVCDDPEVLLVMKTRRAVFSALRAKVVELHPYDVPEIIALPITDGHPPYLAWIDENT